MSEDSTASGETPSIYIGNLDYSTRWYQLKDHLTSLGFENAFVNIPLVNGKSKGFGTAQFKTIQEAERAVEVLNNSKLRDRELLVHIDRMRRVLFKGLPYRLKWQDLKDLCRDYGRVVKADIHVGPDGRPNGLGSVYFQTKDDADACIAALNGSLLQGREIFCHLYVYHPRGNKSGDDENKEKNEDGQKSDAASGSADGEQDQDDEKGVSDAAAAPVAVETSQ